ncbi:MAG TPA: bifunctional DNA-formamidopyrimidine glycosylase/DNA-(apurinic or apyrimidinic site) lyase [Gemmatimonadales bacterium]|nr:bifunctional DNA-formamidopyrimidine glycosylase/DNA-(apurinic or apyrimidinic site) lyase [Gemmatimonadales bacterium]
MPELPEVETIVRDLAPRMVGRRIASATLAKTDVLRKITKPALLRALRGARVTAVTRRAKHAVFHLSGGRRMVIRLGMTGALVVYDRPLTPPETKYAVLVLELGPRPRLRFVYRDVRRFGSIWLLDDAGWGRYETRLGPEPLDPAFTPDVLAAQLAGSRAAVKKVIMDQGKVVGVGNIYANEALFSARIDPSRPASSLTDREVRALHRAIVAILERAIKAEGTTFRDYRTGTGQPGSFQLRLNVYGRGGEPCRRCGRRLVTTHSIDARATTMCAWCQG